MDVLCGGYIRYISFDYMVKMRLGTMLRSIIDHEFKIRLIPMWVTMEISQAQVASIGNFFIVLSNNVTVGLVHSLKSSPFESPLKPIGTILMWYMRVSGGS